MRLINFSLFTFLLVAIVSFFNAVIADEKEWHLAYEADGINVYKRITEGSKFFEFNAVGNLQGTVSEYLSVILDTDEHPDWVPRCLQTQKIEKISDQELIIYAVYAGVWPTSDRDYAARMSITSKPDVQTIRVDIERIELTDVIPGTTDRVHIPHLKSSWIFEQIGRNLTRVELRAHVDPGGWIPSWLVNWGYREIPYQFLKNLESQVAKHIDYKLSLAKIPVDPH
ncbi:hypothetical protein SCALIN_C28_0056 [Candidatus Scalindua japonica]|uniref:START domain-containing protein n=1 Tax=Candidatus Scalindua japonica TaxID=1284222 RepID=A0A286U142_9BACT|nr:START domain-containing protein [Candidatus Scalindua japonica]GAX61854.1 hypothetical protein SCALIN_C28_0056 [Candidatus Scalindua japonica]